MSNIIVLPSPLCAGKEEHMDKVFYTRTRIFGAEDIVKGDVEIRRRDHFSSAFYKHDSNYVNPHVIVTYWDDPNAESGVSEEVYIFKTERNAKQFLANIYSQLAVESLIP